MKFTINDLDHLTNLAKLELSEKEKKPYLKQLDGIISFVEKLQKIKIKPGEIKLEKNNNQRLDIVSETPKETRQTIIKQFSEKSGDLLKTKAIFERK